MNHLFVPHVFFYYILFKITYINIEKISNVNGRMLEVLIQFEGNVCENSSWYLYQEEFRRKGSTKIVLELLKFWNEPRKF